MNDKSNIPEHSICKRCGKTVTDTYCSNCGLKKELNRIDYSYLTQELGSLFFFEKGFLYTVKEMLVRPGKSVRRFLYQERDTFVKPLIFVIVTSVIYSILNYSLGFKDGYIKFSDSAESYVLIIGSLATSNYGYTNITIAICITFWVKLLFKHKNINFYEIAVLICYLLGVEMLIFALGGILETIFSGDYAQLAAVISMLYLTWGIGQFFNEGKKVYFKGFLSYMLGVVTWLTIVSIIGLSLDYITINM